ncbi:unnamed protein product [Soboliphyme baturini]|uniref:MFS domain-containing protein n=1 Tax=Soboliphyme baturini TaxID=241478 RepID=A0A183IVL8_9BILA|nr:unnamed protein product [Soboliphyme baturini]
MAMLAATIGSSFVFGYNIGVMNAPEIVMKDWLNETFFTDDWSNASNEGKVSNLWALIVSVFPLGGLLGGMISGLLAEKLGSAAICPMYLTEISPISIRGMLGSTPQLTLTIGTLVSQILGLRNVLGTEMLWPLLLVLTGVPGIIQLLTLGFCPESPVHLITKGKVEQAGCGKGFCSCLTALSLIVTKQE